MLAGRGYSALRSINTIPVQRGGMVRCFSDASGNPRWRNDFFRSELIYLLVSFSRSFCVDKYDVVVIGGGPGGYVAAIKASQMGLKVGYSRNIVTS